MSGTKAQSQQHPRHPPQIPNPPILRPRRHPLQRPHPKPTLTALFLLPATLATILLPLTFYPSNILALAITILRHEAPRSFVFYLLTRPFLPLAPYLPHHFASLLLDTIPPSILRPNPRGVLNDTPTALARRWLANTCCSSSRSPAILARQFLFTCATMLLLGLILHNSALGRTVVHCILYWAPWAYVYLAGGVFVLFVGLNVLVTVWRALRYVVVGVSAELWDQVVLMTPWLGVAALGLFVVMCVSGILSSLPQSSETLRSLVVALSDVLFYAGDWLRGLAREYEPFSA
ncbi:hypothetical protein QBC47DRAFT_405452 [Echria macrotheca]|uniref:Uncharacterized protein n=1 Tax=Echria macrotheca TaxID=438768 RepID=A0AAJ0F8L6_9PEZI|nr:hypothetical protein QBC47DRAFT_405452 [Echria macrotheca]